VTEQRYLRAGHRAHLLPAGVDLTTYPYTRAYCGREPDLGDAWLGTGNQTEYDTAEALPLCRACAKARDRRKREADRIAAILAARRPPR
jgi:hypothetical protein